MTVSVKRNLCMFLAVVMVCVFLPLSGSVQAVSSSQEEQTEAVAKQGVYEVVALRDENVKHFALPDGMYQAVLYGEAIHELDTNGQWQEIDNNMQLSNIRGTEVYSDASGRTAFAKKLSLNKPVFSIANGGYGISMAIAQNTLSTQTMALEGAMPEAQVTNSAARRSTTWTSVEEAVVFDRSSTVSYADALPGVDLNYTVRNRNVEEHIVIKSKSNDYSYQFELDLEGLSACQEADGSISLLDCRTNQRKYVIPTGLMYDANETVSYDVEYALTEVDGKYCLSIDPDAEWINDPSRAMPVTVAQPTINEGTIHDTFVRNMYPNATHGTSSVIWLANQSPTVGNAEALIRGEFPDLPGNATVLDAYMRAYYYYNDNVTTGTFNVGVYPLVDSWTEWEATWNNSRNLQGTNSWIYVAFTSAANSATINTPKPINVPMTSLVQGWANDSTTNHGVKLKYESGTNRSVCLRSSESGSTYSPRFYVTYEINRLPDGVYALTSGTNVKKASYNSFNAGGNVRQVTSPANLTDEHLFKFSYLGKVAGEDYFVIRPMMNNGLGLYATAEGPVIANDVAVTNDWDSIPASQRWAVTYVDGFYQIRNGEGGYLSVPSSTGVYLVTTATATSNSAWRLDKQLIITNKAVFVEQHTEIQLPSQAEYEFTAVVRSYDSNRNGPVRYFVVDEEGNPTDKAEFIDNSNKLIVHEPGIVKVGATFDEATEITWTLVYIYYTSIVVDCFYDQAYAARFSNTLNRIANSTHALQSYYINNYGVYIDISSPNSFSSYADRCPNMGSDYDGYCVCGGDVCTNHAEAEYDQNPDENPEESNTEYFHHKNVYNILYDFDLATSSANKKIAFIGHVTCRQLDKYTHLGDSSIAGLASIILEAACITDRTDNVNHETYVLIHEFGHLLGLEDHYDDEAYDGDTNKALIEINNGDENGPYKANCMYGSQWTSNAWQFDLTLCDGCKAYLNNYFSLNEGE